MKRKYAHLTNSQVTALKNLASDFGFKSRIANSLLVLANQELSERVLVEAQKEKRGLIYGHQWNSIKEGISKLNKQILDFLGYDKGKIDVRFTVLDWRKLNISPAVPSTKEALQTHDVFEVLALTQRALRLAEQQMSIPGARKKGRPLDRQNQIMVERFSIISVEAGIKPSAYGRSDFVASLRQYMKILELSGNAEAIASKYKKSFAKQNWYENKAT